MTPAATRIFTVSTIAILAIATANFASAANVALGGKWLGDGAFWQPSQAAFDGNTGEYTGAQAGWTGTVDNTNRLFGCRLPTASLINSFELFITGGQGSRTRPKDVEVYYEGGQTTLTLPNADQVVSLPAPVHTSWLPFRELNVYPNNTDLNYFLNELEIYGTADTGELAGNSLSHVTGATTPELADGTFHNIGGFYAPAEAGGSIEFTAYLDGSPINAIALTQDIADTGNANRIAYNMARELTLTFNDPAATMIVLGDLNTAIADGGDYDHVLPVFYNTVALPMTVTGASQVTVTMIRQDPEPTYGPGPFTPTLPIGDRKTWGTAGSDNNRWGIIEFEAFYIAPVIPEPGTAAILLAATLLFRRRR